MGVRAGSSEREKKREEEAKMFRDPLNINHGVLWLLLLLVCWAPTERGNEREREREKERENYGRSAGLPSGLVYGYPG